MVLTKKQKIYVFVALFFLFYFILSSQDDSNFGTTKDFVAEKEPIISTNGTVNKRIDHRHIELKTEKGLMIFAVPDSLLSKLENTKDESFLRFTYQKNKKGLLEIQSIDEVKNQKQMVVTPEKVIPPKTLPNGLTFASKQGFSFENMEDFFIIQHTDSSDFHIKVEELDLNKEIKVERWHAADLLKSTGPLTELKGDQIPTSIFKQADFVFHAENEAFSETIFVYTIEDVRFRFTVHLDLKDEELETISSMIYELLDTLSYTK